MAFSTSPVSNSRHSCVEQVVVLVSSVTLVALSLLALYKALFPQSQQFSQLDFLKKMGPLSSGMVFGAGVIGLAYYLCIACKRAPSTNEIYSSRPAPLSTTAQSIRARTVPPQKTKRPVRRPAGVKPPFQEHFPDETHAWIRIPMRPIDDTLVLEHVKEKKTVSLFAADLYKLSIWEDFLKEKGLLVRGYFLVKAREENRLYWDIRNNKLRSIPNEKFREVVFNPIEKMMKVDA